MRMPARGLPEPLPGILERFLADLRARLGAELVGAYAYGSAIVGDFDPDRSDLDVCVVTRSPVDRIPRATFDGLIERLAEREPAWADRLDVVFIGAPTLARFREGGPLVSISHDEPLQRYDDADTWLQTWYLVRTADWPLAGPSVSTLVPDIRTRAFVAAVAADAARIQRRATADASDDLLAYVVLTHARVLAALDGAGLVSKPEAGRRMRATHPGLAAVIDAALIGREGSRPLNAAERGALLSGSALLAAEIDARSPTR